MTDAERSRMRYAADPEFWRAKSRAYYARHRKRILAEVCAFYAENEAWRELRLAERRERYRRAKAAS